MDRADREGGEKVKTRSICAATVLYTLLHFATDGLCALMIYGYLYADTASAVAVFFGYNAAAFLLQPAVGLLADRVSRPRLLLVLCLPLLSAGCLCAPCAPLAACLLGLGNALVHAVGGKELALLTSNDTLSLGIFVSTGAVGLALGRYSPTLPWLLLFAFLLVACAAALLLLPCLPCRHETPSVAIAPHAKTNFLLWVALAVVLCRAFIGRAALPAFSLGAEGMLLLAFASAVGKAFGGVAVRLFGVRRVMLVSLPLAAVALTLGNAWLLPYLLGTALFQLTMPVTLTYANRALPGHEGFAFGIAAAVLLPGYLLGMLFPYTVYCKLLVAFLCVLSLLALLYAERRARL